MKWSVDGDQICVTKDSFVNLQESPAVFIPRDSEAGRAIENGGILNMPLGDLCAVRNLLLLQDGGGEYRIIEEATVNDQDWAEQVKETAELLVEEEVQASRFQASADLTPLFQAIQDSGKTEGVDDQPSRFQAFADYAEAYWAMQDDPLVRFIKLQVVRLNGALKRAEKFYRTDMAEAGREIEAVALELGQTVEVAGVTASYTKGVARPSWKAVAMTFEPGRELIDEHTKVGKPSVRIKMTEGKEERA